MKQGLASSPEKWTYVFREQTGHNVNVAVNAIRKLYMMIANERGQREPLCVEGIG